MTDSTPPATTARLAPPDAPTGPLSHRQIVTILIGLMMGMFLAALDQTIVAPPCAPSPTTSRAWSPRRG